MPDNVIRTRFGIEVPLKQDMSQFAMFDYSPAGTRTEAEAAALSEYGAPRKGLMVVRDGTRYAISDGVNPHTGQQYTTYEEAAIRDQVDELIVLD